MTEDLTELRIGAYGGTFDPIHNGHVEVARATIKHFGLDQLLVIPAGAPPHKPERAVTESYHRYAMAVIATLDESHLLVSTLEIERPDRPYTFETMDRVRFVYGPGAKLFFIMGSDSFEEVHMWREPLRLLSNVNLIVASRPGYEPAGHGVPGLSNEYPTDWTPTSPGTIEVRDPEGPAAVGLRLFDFRGPEGQNVEVDLSETGPGGSIYLTHYVDADVSSTDIRWRVSNGLSIDGLVHSGVADYIERYGLYRRESALPNSGREGR